MFHLRNGRVTLVDSDADVCAVEDLDTAISELMALKGDLTSTESAEEDDEDRYTSEGIDRRYRADDAFIPSREQWREDSLKDWSGIGGKVLFQRYQSHAESYCWGCFEYGQEPTYEGFRQWLIQLRDMAGEEDTEI